MQQEKEPNIVGRFAPSPTGPLHFGSLIAALGSYMESKSRGGKWLLRMEDLDPPRTVAGAADEILRSLEQHQLHWDGAVLYQSRRSELYQQALEQLDHQHCLFGCRCTRKQLKEAPIYPGHCRTADLPLQSHAVRIQCRKQTLSIEDHWQGRRQWQLEQEIGDFVIRRADGLYAYQLAVVVDDHLQGVTEVIRGSDLLDSTPRQLYLQQMLGYPTPHYGHLPVATHANGQKLSKQNLAPPLDNSTPAENIAKAFTFLGHPPPPRLSLGSLWEWAFTAWDSSAIPSRMNIAIRVDTENGCRIV